LFCPEPVFRTKIAIEKMQVGQVLTVLADDPAAEDDISRWVNRNGHQLLNMNKKNNVIEFTIKKVK
jgi:TusA-related sulfurtransferase